LRREERPRREEENYVKKGVLPHQAVRGSSRRLEKGKLGGVVENKGRDMSARRQGSPIYYQSNNVRERARVRDMRVSPRKRKRPGKGGSKKGKKNFTRGVGETDLTQDNVVSQVYSLGVVSACLSGNFYLGRLVAAE